jgi:tRNA A37 threonylcarbamoyladenosine modification protein TsaB
MLKNILAIDTTMPHVSLWLHLDSKDFLYQEEALNNSNDIVFKWLNELFKKFPELLNQIECYGLNIGPGRFNGVRVGMSIIGTLSAINPRPLYTCTSFDLLKEQAQVGDEYTAAIYAKKGYAYVLRPAQSPVLLRFSDIEDQKLCVLQCPEIEAHHSYDFNAINLIAGLIKKNKFQKHETFQSITPLYTALI